MQKQKNINALFFLFALFLLSITSTVSAQEVLKPTPAQRDAFIQTLSPEKKDAFLKLSPEEQDMVVPIPDDPTLAQKQDPSTLPDGAVNCFDYYTFGSVQVDVESTLAQTLPGLPIVFTGTIKNNNAYPITDGSVYVKIFKTNGAKDADIQKNGYPVVDEFFAKENISLSGKKDLPFSFEWKAPNTLPKGDYEANFFFMTGKRFNLLGLSFTDDITGNKAPFSIGGTNAETASFDKNLVTINGKPYLFATPPPRFTKEENVQTEVTIVNPTNRVQTAEMAWTLYNWSGEREENKIDTKTESITLKPNEKKKISYTATPDKAKGTVSFLRAELTNQGVKSLLNIRFVRDGFDEMRINFPSVTNYPLRKGEKNTLFSCVHSTNVPILPNGELMLTLKDASGKIIDTYTYTGNITGEMMGVKHNFTPKVSSADFTLEATLKNNGQVVETYLAKYDCKDIDPALCQGKEKKSALLASSKNVEGENGLSNILFKGIALAIALAVVGVIIWYVVRGGRGVAMFLLFGFLVSVFLIPNEAEAKSAVWNTVVNKTLYRRQLSSDKVNASPISGGGFAVCDREKTMVASSVSTTQNLSMASGESINLYGYLINGGNGTSSSSSGGSILSGLSSLYSSISPYAAYYTYTCSGSSFSVADKGKITITDDPKSGVVTVKDLTLSARKPDDVTSANELVTIVYSDNGKTYTIKLSVTVRANTSIWYKALANPNVSITYNAQAVDGATGKIINDGTALSVGSKVRFEPTAHKNTDISWVGTGFNDDSPYGHWMRFALKPFGSTCDNANYLTAGGVFVPFSVDPPEVSFRHAGTAQLTCDQSGSECTIASPGTIESSVAFKNTFGKFYFGRLNESGCEENDTPLVTMGVSNVGVFSLQVPEVTVPFSFNAVAIGNPPTPPIITGPVTGGKDQSHSFSFGGSTDPDGDTIRYEVDWDQNGTVDQLLPSTGYVASGSAQDGAYMWSTIGSKTFQAKACDDKGACSGWTQHTIVIDSIPFIAEESPILNFSADSTALSHGNSGTTLRWTVMNVSSCTASDSWSGSKAFDPVVEHSESTGSLASGTHVYTLTCAASSGTGSVTKAVTVTVGPAVDTCAYIASTCNASNCGRTLSNLKFCTRGGVVSDCATVAVSCTGSSTTKCPACSSVYKEVAP